MIIYNVRDCIQYSFQLLEKNSRVPLGRWDYTTNTSIKSLLANIDSCGDIQCKNINLPRAAIRSVINEKK